MVHDMKLSRSIFAAMTIASAVPVHAAPPLTILRHIAHETRDDLTKPTPSALRAAIRPVDLDSDARTDWAVDFGKFDGPAWCGTGGRRLVIWHGEPGGKARIVFDQQVRAHHWRNHILVTDEHGSHCGGFGSQACPTEYRWLPRQRMLVEQPRPAKYRYHM